MMGPWPARSSDVAAVHRTALRQLDRDALECQGWRTTLEFRENLVRSDAGQLVGVDSMWLAEAERDTGGGLVVLSACARSESRVWAKLLADARSSDRTDPFAPPSRSAAASSTGAGGAAPDRLTSAGSP